MKTPDISTFQLFLSLSLVLGAGILSAALKIGVLKHLAWATFRTFVQLSLIGYALRYIFQLDHPLVIIALIGVMTLLAARAAVARMKNVPFQPTWIAALSLAAGTYLIGTFACAFLINADRWWTAKISVPIAGMILGNTLNGVSLSLDRFVSDLRQRSSEIEQLLCLGYTPWEAVRRPMRAAIKAGMTPILNSLMIAGLVSLPGMMTGQILAGADPLKASRYQIIIMMMVTASVAIGTLLLVTLSYRKCFTSDAALTEKILERMDE